MYKVDEDYSINVASNEDRLEELYELILRAASESPYRDEPYDEEILKNNLKSLMSRENPNNLVLTLSYKDKFVGVLIATVTNQHFFFHVSKISFELLWFVDKEHRKGKPSDALRQAYEYWAKLSGCTKVTMGDFEGKLSNFYKRKGYTHLESVYIKEI